MSNIYSVTNKHIESLNDKQLTKILSRLLYLEADKNKISKSSVNCSMEITVSDGGEDASIKWSNGPDNTDWFRCRNNLFQCKATEMAPSKCKDEILFKDKNGDVKLKPMVEKVLDDGGCYILFYNRSLNSKYIGERINKFREAIKEAGKVYYNSSCIVIYDANKIAEWVNNYLAAIIEVLEYNRICLPANLLTWSEWSGYEEYRKYSFETDETIESYIKQLREHFSQDEINKVARIIGLSGLGKTRIALEVFRKDGTQEREILHNKVVYIDINNKENEVVHLIIELRRIGISGIIVVDNCSIEMHKKLVREIEHQESKLSILTLDFNLENITAPYPIIQINQISTDVIKKIIKQSYKNIPEDDINRIADFAQGFPQMAVLISEARLNGEDTIGTLNDTEIANKLLWGRDNEDELKLEVIKSCAIFENFGFYDDRSIEKDYIAENICDDRIDKEKFYKHAQYFIKKGILDKRGRYLAVTPLPLAIRLAAEWWRECSPEKGKRIILSEMPNNMVEFLCKQIGKLHFVEEARSLTSDLCSDTGPFGQAEVLTTKRGGRIFRALSRVNPSAATMAIFNAFKRYSLEELKVITSERRDLVWALEDLAFWEETFDDAVRTLIMFSASENETWSNNATGVTKQLFHIFLSGTQATPQQRLSLLRETLSKKEEEYKAIAVKLLGSAIQTQGFSRTLGTERQGTRPTQEEWKPSLWKEVFDYWEEALSILSNIAKNGDSLANDAREAIILNFRGLVQYGRMEALDTSLKIVGESLNYIWPSLNEAINKTIKFDGSKLPSIGREKLVEWLQIFTPRSFSDSLRLIVSIPSRDHEKDIEGHYVDISAIRCREFVKECLDNINELYSNLIIIYTGEQRQGYVFGEELGLSIKEPQLFIEQSIECLKNASSPNPIVLASFLKALRIKDSELADKTLDSMCFDNILKNHLPYITSIINPMNRDIDRIINLLYDKKMNISGFRSLSYGRPMEKIEVENINKLCMALCNFNTEGKFIALEIINSYDQKLPFLMDTLKALVLDIDIIYNFNTFSQMDDYYWEENVKFLLNTDEGETYANKLYSIIRNNLNSDEFNIDRDRTYEKILSIIFEKYPKETWNLVVNDLLELGEEESQKLEDLLGADWLYIDDGASLIEMVNEHYVIESIKKYGESLALIISRVIRKYDNDGNEVRFNPVLKYIIENYGANNIDMLNDIAFRMGPTSWVGSLLPQYEDKIKVLSEYAEHNELTIKNWAKERIKALTEVINREKIREEEEAKGIY
jgi:hypothetical protein